MTGLRTTPPAPEDVIREFHEIVRNRAAVFPYQREGDGAIHLSYEKWCRLDIALASLVAAKEAADEKVCQFGCGPEPDDGSHVGGPGIGVVPACPVHGWMVPLLDTAARQRASLAEALREIADLADKRQGPGSTTARLARAALAEDWR